MGFLDDLRSLYLYMEFLLEKKWNYRFGGISSSLIIENLQLSQMPSGFSVSLTLQIEHIIRI